MPTPDYLCTGPMAVRGVITVVRPPATVRQGFLCLNLKRMQYIFLLIEVRDATRYVLSCYSVVCNALVAIAMAAPVPFLLYHCQISPQSRALHT